MLSRNLGRHVFGVAALGFGLITLIWHDSKYLEQLRPIVNAGDGPFLVYAVGALQVFGGAAIQFERTAKVGAAVLGAVYLVFALMCMPGIAATPKVYNAWGNFFEQFSLAAGAMLAYAASSSVWAPEARDRIGRLFVGICSVSFALEQAFYLKLTADLVPKWIPPGQMFWAIATTIAFALAAVALLTNIKALLAARLLTAMLVSFGLIVWVPIVLSDLHNYGNWSEFIETVAIAGTTWILADLLGERRRNGRAITG